MKQVHRSIEQEAILLVQEIQPRLAVIGNTQAGYGLLIPSFLAQFQRA